MGPSSDGSMKSIVKEALDSNESRDNPRRLREFGVRLLEGGRDGESCRRRFHEDSEGRGVSEVDSSAV
jgi:hypothetical protein